MMNNKIKSYRTERLELIAATLEHINAELNDLNLFASMLNAEVSPEWPPGEYDKNAQEYFRDLLIKGGEDLTGWLGWYAIKPPEEKQTAVLIGAGGYFGPPSEIGEIEIGYSVIPSYQKKGYATEIVRALVDIASKDSLVKRISARTTDSNKASCTVLEKNGFKCSSRDLENNILYEKILEK
jgi:RimJ/RimL family protein N-acetyltransferase